MGHALHVAQDAVHHLFQIGLALAQVVVLHLVELAADHFQLRGQRPFGVVQALGDPVLDAAGQHFILQQHQMHVQQGGQFMRCIRRHFALQALQFVHHGIAAMAHAVDLALDLVRLDEVVGHFHAARAHQHSTSDRNATRHGQARNGKRHCPLLSARTEGAAGPMLIRLRRTCRQSAPAARPWLPARARQWSRSPLSCPCPPPASSRP